MLWALGGQYGWCQTDLKHWQAPFGPSSRKPKRSGNLSRGQRQKTGAGPRACPAAAKLGIADPGTSRDQILSAVQRLHF